MHAGDSDQQKQVLLFQRLVQTLRDHRETTSNQAYDVLSAQMAGEGTALNEADRLGIYAFLTHLEKSGFVTLERRRDIPSATTFYIATEKLFDWEPPDPPSLQSKNDGCLGVLSVLLLLVVLSVLFLLVVVTSAIKSGKMGEAKRPGSSSGAAPITTVVEGFVGGPR
jgi:hypothetical protein